MTADACIGPCNNAARRAKAAHEKAVAEWQTAEETHRRWKATEDGAEPDRRDRPTPPTIRWWPGNPWCDRCTASIRRALTDLDELVPLRLMMADGYQSPAPGEQIRRTKGAAPTSPSLAQDDLDELLAWLRGYEQAYRDSQDAGTIPYRGTAAPALTQAIAWLLPRLDQILTHPGLAADFGKGVLWWHHRLQAATSTRPPVKLKPLPCPRCHRRSLRQHDDGNIHCNNDDCRRVMSNAEYDEMETAADQQVVSR